MCCVCLLCFCFCYMHHPFSSNPSRSNPFNCLLLLVGVCRRTHAISAGFVRMPCRVWGLSAVCMYQPAQAVGFGAFPACCRLCCLATTFVCAWRKLPFALVVPSVCGNATTICSCLGWEVGRRWAWHPSFSLWRDTAGVGGGGSVLCSMRPGLGLSVCLNPAVRACFASIAT